METVLIAAERQRGDEIKRMLPPGGYVFIRAENEREARMKILDISPSLAVIDVLLPGGGAKDVSVFAASQDVDTVLIVPDELSAHMSETMGKYGVYTVSFSRDSMWTMFSVLRIAREKIEKAEEKNRKLLARLRNEKMLTEAKCLLARHKGMSEAGAHSFIEKKSMNCRVSLTDAAMSIIRELS